MRSRRVVADCGIDRIRSLFPIDGCSFWFPLGLVFILRGMCPGFGRVKRFGWCGSLLFCSGFLF
jgi:hypothetical protein